MKTVLIVDDEPRLLQSMQAGLRVHKKSFSTVTAINGKEALSIISTAKIDLVVTDLKMPVMDGFELIVHISNHYPSLPVIVMTAFNTPEIEQQIDNSNSLKLLEKPIDFEELSSSILEALERHNEEGSLSGISLTSFLQLIETEQKTCLIEVNSINDRGFIYFNHGELYSAIFGKLKGEEAIYGMLMLADVEIKIRKQVKKKFKKTIQTPLFPLLMEGMKRKDEISTLSQKVAQNPSNNSDNGGDKTQSLLPDNNQIKEGDEIMSTMKEIMGKLADVEGFLAVGIFTPNGEMAAEVNNSGLKLDEIGSLANDVLLKAQKATDLMDVGRGQVVHVDAPKAHIIARCLNENTDFTATEAGKAHLHMVLILSKDGNLAMAKMKMGSIIQEVAPEFR